MRERGRARERGAVSRALLGRPCRSPPSPEVRHIRGGVSVDSGNWTEVRNRRRKAPRREYEVDNKFWQRSGYRFHHANSKPRRYVSSDHHDGLHPLSVRDYYQNGRDQTRFGRERSCEFRRQVSLHQRARSVSRRRVQATRHVSRARLNDSRSAAACPRWQYFDGVEAEVEGRRDRFRDVRKVENSGHGFRHVAHDAEGVLGSNFKRYVSFYFTNFPAQLSIFYLRKGFEVCGMLEDVYVSNKRNRFGEPYGFVRFSNVKDVSKMTKALNSVWFGQFRVRASVAKFERNTTVVVTRSEEEQVGLPKGIEERKNGNHSPTRQVTPKDGDPGSKETTPKVTSGGVGAPRLEKEVPGVQVGDIVVPLGNRKTPGARIEGIQHGEEQPPKDPDVPAVVAKGRESRVFLRKYRSKPDDVQWAQNGIVATVINGVPMVQNRIVDAGFDDLVITPMGADKVFIRCTEGGDAMSVVGGAEEFFKLIFSNWTRWDKDGRPYQRGAWVRLYGVPLNAWNVDFFKLCVFDCGRFLRADSCSAGKDRLDFARVLIATSELDIVTTTERVLVDGVMEEIRIVEEWGYAMGEDTCLFEEENGSEPSQADEDEGHEGSDVRCNVDLLVEKIVDELQEDDGDAVSERCGSATPIIPSDKPSMVGVSVEEDNWSEAVLSPVGGRTRPSLSIGSSGELGDRNLRTDVSCIVPETQDCPTDRITTGEDRSGFGCLPRGVRATSCPPTANGRVHPGPWSWEWLRDHNHKNARVADKGEGHPDTLCRKAGGVLRHPVHSLKKLARLPSKDRGEALKAIGKCVRRRRAGVESAKSNSASSQDGPEDSSMSGTVNNDWMNWVAVHGNDQMAVDDVRGIGQTIGVTFKGDNDNMFNVLSRAGRGIKENSGLPKGKGARKEKSV
ncbi:heterogeneous nuclear ribonucleoprotein A0 [Trifolium repens]|nr:heterogeneous nuclear ribonucleoprotein A0 [Trifolium repens]